MTFSRLGGRDRQQINSRAGDVSACLQRLALAENFRACQRGGGADQSDVSPRIEHQRLSAPIDGQTRFDADRGRLFVGLRRLRNLQPVSDAFAHSFAEAQVRFAISRLLKREIARAQQTAIEKIDRVDRAVEHGLLQADS